MAGAQLSEAQAAAGKPEGRGAGAEGRQYVVDHFTIADAALFYVEFWAERIGMPLPENCEAHYRRMLPRPAVRQLLAAAGYASVLR